MSLSECEKCGGHIPLGPHATNRCEKCGEHVMGTPTGYPPALDAAVRERQGAPVPKVRIICPDGVGHPDSFLARDRVWVDAIRAAGCVPVNAKGEEL